MYSLPQLPVSAPPTSLSECFFFNSLVVRLPYSFFFMAVLIIFVFKFVVVLLKVVQGDNLYLPMPPSWPEVYVNPPTLESTPEGSNLLVGSGGSD